MTQDKKNLREFFQALFDGTRGYIEVRAIDPTGKVERYFYTVKDIDRLSTQLTDPDLSDFKNTNVYFGVCPRREKQGKEEK